MLHESLDMLCALTTPVKHMDASHRISAEHVVVVWVREVLLDTTALLCNDSVCRYTSRTVLR